ncbi:MAG: type II secretion system F family protein, partial [Planctomycetota bacterium]
AVVGGIGLAYLLIAQSLKWRRAADALLLKIPVVGQCLRNFALARFSWAFALTQNAGMDIRNSLHASFAATENGAFAAQAPQVWAEVEAGAELSESLRETGLFPQDYLSMVDVAEASGSVPEMLERIGPDLEADARRSLTALAGAVGWLVWGLVGLFIGYIVIRFFVMYAEIINGGARGDFEALERLTQ